MECLTSKYAAMKLLSFYIHYRSGISEEKRPYEGLPQAVRRISICLRFPVALNLALNRVPNKAR